MTSWFTSTLQSVRDKSIDALEFVRKDLSEFTTTVKTDTEIYLNKVKSQPVGNLGINRIVSRLNRTITSDDDGGKHVVASVSFDRLHNEKRRLQNDESTYLVDPTPIEAYTTWREKSDFNVDKRKGDIAQLLIDAPHLRSLYARLVPACTTPNDFWSRYYFRLYQLDEDETRRFNLLKRAHEICNENNGNDWDGPDDEWSQAAAVGTQQSTLITTTTTTTNSEKITNERKESDTVSGDSWERVFDETDLGTSKTNLILSNQLQEKLSCENLTLPKEATSAKKTNDEFDDEWESWA